MVDFQIPENWSLGNMCKSIIYHMIKIEKSSGSTGASMHREERLHLLPFLPLSHFHFHGYWRKGMPEAKNPPDFAKEFLDETFFKKDKFRRKVFHMRVDRFPKNKRLIGMRYCPLPGFFLVTGPGVVVLPRRWNPGRKAWFYISHWLINKLLANFWYF